MKYHSGDSVSGLLPQPLPVRPEASMASRRLLCVPSVAIPSSQTPTWHIVGTQEMSVEWMDVYGCALVWRCGPALRLCRFSGSEGPGWQ